MVLFSIILWCCTVLLVAPTLCCVVCCVALSVVLCGCVVFRCVFLCSMVWVVLGIVVAMCSLPVYAVLCWFCVDIALLCFAFYPAGRWVRCVVCYAFNCIVFTQ